MIVLLVRWEPSALRASEPILPTGVCAWTMMCGMSIPSGWIRGGSFVADLRDRGSIAAETPPLRPWLIGRGGPIFWHARPLVGQQNADRVRSSHRGGTLMFRLRLAAWCMPTAQPPDIFGSASEGHDRRWVGTSVGARSSAGADDRASPALSCCRRGGSRDSSGQSRWASRTAKSPSLQVVLAAKPARVSHAI